MRFVPVTIHNNVAQGFPKDYIIDHYIDGTSVTHKEQVARIGNSVVPVMAKALVAANVPYLKVGERMPNIQYHFEGKQMAFA